MIQALLIDLDDTLLDEHAGRRLARDAAVALITAAYADLAGSDVAAALDAASHWFWSDPERHRVGRQDMPGSRRIILGRVLEHLGHPDAPLADRVTARYQQIRDDAMALFPGVRDTLAQLRARYRRLGLITNGAAIPQQAKIDRFGLAGFFDHIQIEGALGCGKPEEAAFRHALTHLGTPAAETVMIGNDFDHDITPALALGMPAIWICPEGSARPEDAPRMRHVAAFPEVPRVLPN